MPETAPDIRNNIGYLCTRAVCERGLEQKTAIRWLSPALDATDITFGMLEEASNRAANLLTGLGVQPGERVFTFLPRTPELVHAFLGALKVCAVVGVLFSNFGEDALLDRLGDSAACLLVTKKSYLRKLRAIWKQLPHLHTILVVDLADDDTRPEDPGRVLSFPRRMAQCSPQFDALPAAPGTPSVLHYTSGSTGKPKGVQHVHHSILSQAGTFRGVLGVQDDDIYWCTADPGWVTGVSYGIIGPLSQGVTQVQFSGNYDAAAWFRILQDQKVNVWYTAPTALRMVMQEEESLFRQFDLAHLRHIFSVGEPLNPAVIHWVRRVLGREVYDTWFQTETGAIMISNHPGLPVRPGSMGMPVEGIEAAILDESGAALPDLQHGRLCLRRGWPSMFAAYLNRPEQYAAKFQGGFYDSGDMAYRDPDGYFWFVGRGDDVINTAGHLVSPFEVESALLEIPEVAGTGVVGAPDEMLFEKVVAYITLRPPAQWSRELEVKVRTHVSNRVSSIATPQDIRIVDSIPRNKSGKIMRRVLKAWYTGQDVGDISTLEE